MITFHLGLGAAVTACAIVAAAGLETAVADDKAGRATGLPEASIATSLPGNGDIGGHRARLAGHGVTYGVNYIGEVWRNPSGGVSRATVADGRLELVVDADFNKLLGWQGASFHVNGYYIQSSSRQDDTGQYGLSSRHIQNLMTISNIEAFPSTRLFEAWLQQKLFEGRVSIRLGQLAADSEFAVSEHAGQFVNGTFGWPVIGGANLVNGGPAYPLATPGARLQVDVTDRISLLAGVFNGDPAGRGAEQDPQRRNRHGFNWQAKDKPFAIAEAQVNWNREEGSAGLAGTFKLGIWHHFGSFEDQRIVADGLSLAVSAEDARRREGNPGFYAVLDQQLYRAGGMGLGAFFRVATMPSDRNLVDFTFDTGLKAWGFMPGRKDDSAGLALSYARISDRARALDRDLNLANDLSAAVRDYELTVEANYTAQIVPGWTVQPVFQYIWHPGGHAIDPTDVDATKAIKDAAVVGARTTINY